MPPAVREDALPRHQRSMVEPPEEIVHLEPVPRAAHAHGDHQVEALARKTPAVAAERDVDVIADPEGQRHVPPSPELADARREVRMVEVLGEPEPGEQPEADDEV